MNLVALLVCLVSAAGAQQLQPAPVVAASTSSVAVSSSASPSYQALSEAVDRALRKNAVAVVAADGSYQEDPNQPCLVDPKAANVHLSAGALSNPSPAHTSFERAAFWSSFAAYQATWVADMVTTGMELTQPGRWEGDPLYTMFGNRSMAGVLGSSAVVHAAATALGLFAYDRAKNATGWGRVALDTLAIGTNTVGTAAHTFGTVNNIIWIQRPTPSK
jgi:hypothetical protein